MVCLKMKDLLLISFGLLCIAMVECRYPYEDTYRPGDIVPYANGRRGGNDRDSPRNNGRDRNGYRDGQRRRDGYDRPPYGETSPSDYYPISNTYKSRYNRNSGGYLRPRGLGGYNYKSRYGEYDYGKYRRSYPRGGRPSMYSNDEYGDYSDSDSRYD